MCLLGDQHYRCALTGRWLTPQTAALDHIMPIRRGGEHVIENTQVLHKDVNRAKGSLTSEEFLAMCREVVQWAVSVPPKEVRS
jgi:5-methylcytosine-specific restriction endonuclease McrA